MNDNEKWSDTAWIYSEDVYKNIIKLDFINELISGNLSKERFNNYIKQDVLYLKEYGNILIKISELLTDAKQIEYFKRFSSETIQVEEALHKSYIGASIPNTSEYIYTQTSPSNMLYTSFLWKQIASGKVHFVLAAILPCFWVYKEVGDYILSKNISNNNPYIDWINTYGGESFAESVNIAIDICNSLAKQQSCNDRNEMLNIFRYCCKLEWLFWQSAYELEKWKI